MSKYSHNHRRSQRAFERAKRVLVGGVNSPVRAFRSVGGEPLFFSRGEGPFLYDLDGNRYVDLVCSWGTAILGHAHPSVVDAVRKAAASGLSYGACHEAEPELAEIIVSAFPAMEMVRFVNSGTEATMSAIRLARAATGRSRIVKFEGCYHGHVDSLLVAAGSGAVTYGTPDSAGVPQAIADTTLLAPYNDAAQVSKLFSNLGEEIAGVIVEPIAGNMGYVEPSPGFLAELRALCDQHGSLLILDEVMTGFRVAWGGCQTLWNIRPDVTCLGKVIGGGMPLAAYGARRELMELVSPLGPMYQAGTLSGNPVAVAAGLATLKCCNAAMYNRLGEASRKLCEGISGAAKAAGVPVQAGATGGLWGLTFAPAPVKNFCDARAADHAQYARFFHAMLEQGVFLPPSGYEAMFVSSTHDDDVIQEVVEAAEAAFSSAKP